MLRTDMTKEKVLLRHRVFRLTNLTDETLNETVPDEYCIISINRDTFLNEWIVVCGLAEEITFEGVFEDMEPPSPFAN